MAKVLVACEYSGTVRDAFIRAGHEARSCDLLPTDAPGPHHQGDIIELLNSMPDGSLDLIIAHPECTKLCVSGNATYGEGMKKYSERIASAKWTYDFWELAKRKAKAVVFENPVGVLPRLTKMPKPHYVQPYQFGHMEQKKTGLFLHNVLPLTGTNNVYEQMMLLPKTQRQRLHYLPPSADRWKIRSTTFAGIANAMAQQWL
jgi:site-specific DNA-cytosine methylase